MGKAERAKGSRAERAVAACLRAAGWDALTTRAASGMRLGDDIATDAPVSIEVKDHARMELSGWVKQCEENQRDKVGVVWHKKKGVADPEGWYVTMSGANFLRLLGMIRDV